MALISIEEVQPIGQESFQATVCFDHGAKYSLTINNPFTAQQEEALEWYFEEHLRFPFTHQVRARDAAASIGPYGESLFNQIFADRRAYSIYQSCVQAGLPTLSIEIAGSPSFHSLHWEALKDPDLPTPLCLQATMVRKNIRPEDKRPGPLRQSPTLNLLVVTARPAGKDDVRYRTISRPLIDLLRKTQLPVQIELLRPATYEALDRHLRQTSVRYGVGYYQVIHFDMHGALLSHEEFERGEQANRFLFQQRYGRVDLAPYEGEKAFLFFENLSQDKPDPVEASELASLLIYHQIPVTILNACQSSKQTGTAETSLASRLMLAGVRLVLAMGYSVTVSAASLLMRTLYEQLFAKYDLSMSITMARHELYNRKERRVYFNQILDLEDWLLPVVHQNQPVTLNTRAMTVEELTRLHERNASRYNPSQPRYGFVGRDLDILEIEKHLLMRRNILLIRGMGGAGKTTLLHHLGWWWQTTQFIDEVFYFGYDEQAWSRQQIITSIAKHLMSKEEYLSTFQPLSLPAQQSLLAQRLRGQRHLLILDNLESITGAHLSIRNTLSKEEQEALHGLLKDLAEGHTFVLLGSRSSETWLAAGTFGENVYNLPGLDAEAASALAERVLERHNATKYQEDKHLPALISLLDGFPLAIEVVLANLTRQTPAEVLAALQAGDVQLHTGNSQEKTENIVRCIDYSHSNLSAQAQSLLICLAPFTSVFFVKLLERYCILLKEQAALAHLSFDHWQDVLREASNWGLLSPDPDIPELLRLQPILPYFLRARLHTAGQMVLRQAIETAFLELYRGYSSELYGLLNSKQPQEKQLGLLLTQHEYENLRLAVSLAISTRTSILDPYSVLSRYFNLTQEPQRGLEVAQEIQTYLTTSRLASSKGQVRQQLGKIFHDIANWQMQLKHYTEAEQYYQRALQIATKLHESSNQASMYHNLGYVAQEQRQFAQAEQYYQRALKISIKLKDRYRQAGTYRQLGMAAQVQRQLRQAEQYYRQALQLYIEHNDHYEQAGIYHNLGVMAAEQRQFAQAEQYYRQALQLYIEHNDHYEQAGAYHELGIVAEEQRRFGQAEQYYQQALQLYIELKNRYSQARTYNQLGVVAEEQGQFEQAEQYYQQALQLYIEHNDRYRQGITYHNLGIVMQKRRRWEKAKQYYQQALQIKIEHNDLYQQASTYGQLGSLAQNQRQYKQAEQYYHQALQIYIEYNDPNRVAVVLNGLIRLWEGDNDLIVRLASQLKISVEELEGMLHQLLSAPPDETEEQA